MFRSKTLFKDKSWNKQFYILKYTKKDFSMGLIRNADKTDQTSTSSTKYTPVLSIDNINPQVTGIEYAIRGPIPARANQLAKELAAGEKKPFTEVIKLNLGDCHAMGQKPITFIREVLALALYDPLFDNPDISCDAKNRAQEFLDACVGHSIGSYTGSLGLNLVRKQVAKYIERRDGVPSDYRLVFLSSGGTEAIKALFNMLRNDTGPKPNGVMICIPTFPLYTACMTLMHLYEIDYFLDEDHDWGIDICELENAISKAKEVCNPKAIVIINPGNPTGQVMSRETVENVVKFSYNHNLMLIADEVYQHNIYEGEFFSAKKVMHDLGDPYNKLQLVSLNSVSKGFAGECGIRGGYMEIENIDEATVAVIEKLFSTSLCPTSVGQCAIFAVMKPPTEYEPSYKLFMKEKNDILSSLATKAKMATEAFNQMTGITCNEIKGAMYAFPKLELPQKAIEKAKSLKMKPDFFYALELLENTGICVVPGSGFGQKEGTYHIRINTIPPPDVFKTMFERFKVYHENFMQEYK